MVGSLVVAEWARVKKEKGDEKAAKVDLVFSIPDRVVPRLDVCVCVLVTYMNENEGDFREANGRSRFAIDDAAASDSHSKAFGDKQHKEFLIVHQSQRKAGKTSFELRVTR